MNGYGPVPVTIALVILCKYNRIHEPKSSGASRTLDCWGSPHKELFLEFRTSCRRSQTCQRPQTAQLRLSSR